MRQGCPIAAYLYILQAEPMAETIRNNTKIKGINLPTAIPNKSVSVKISMFADDTQIFHSTEASIIESFKTLQIYCKASGAQLNLHKTKGLYIGRWKNKTPEYKKIKWVNSITGLGTVFGHNINYEEIWMKKFFKFKKKNQSWKNRDLTIRGKKLLINSYVMSSISYLSQIYTEHIPPKFISETRNLIRDFLWDGKTWRISQRNLGLSECHGGIALKDLDSFMDCIKMKWIIRIHFSTPSKWNAYGNHILNKLDDKFGIKNFLMQCSNLKGLNIILPAFYKTCMLSWCEYVGKNVLHL